MKPYKTLYLCRRDCDDLDCNSKEVLIRINVKCEFRDCHHKPKCKIDKKECIMYKYGRIVCVKYADTIVSNQN